MKLLVCGNEMRAATSHTCGRQIFAHTHTRKKDSRARAILCIIYADNKEGRAQTLKKMC